MTAPNRYSTLEVFTVAFVGHRRIDRFFDAEERTESLVKRLLLEHEYVDFLVGRDGDFDQIVASAVRRAKEHIRDDNSSLIWVMAYPKAEYANNEQAFDAYYDEVEVCDESAHGHFKAAIQTRNHKMVDHADLLVCYVENNSGGAYQTMQYALKAGKAVINLYEEENS